MRTTVDIPDELYKQVQSNAERIGIPVDALITHALRVVLNESLPTGQRVDFPLHHSKHPGTLTGEDVRTAQEAMTEQEDASRARSM